MLSDEFGEEEPRTEPSSVIAIMVKAEINWNLELGNSVIRSIILHWQNYCPCEGKSNLRRCETYSQVK